MPSRVPFNYSALALGIIAASAPLLSLAGPDACQQDPNNPNAYQCSGNQTYGIDISSSSSNPPSTAQQITVNNLSGNIYGTWTTSNTNGYNVYDAYDIRWTMTDSGPTPAVLIVNTGTHLIDGNILADGAAAVQVTSQGANGQDKADQHSTEIIGHAGRSIQLTFDGTINPSAALGIMATSTGGMGGLGQKNETGGAGGLGGAVTVNLSGAITAGTTPSHSQTSYAVYAASVGGAGNIGGDHEGDYGGAGGHGGQASDVRTTSSGTSITSNLAPGVYLLSQGGAGSRGGYGSTRGGDGGDGGAAGNIFIDAPADFTAAKRQAGTWGITTSSANAPALLLQSIGGIGGGG